MPYSNINKQSNNSRATTKKLSSKNEVLLTLMRLRLSLLNEDLEDRFCISIILCSTRRARNSKIRDKISSETFGPNLQIDGPWFSSKKYCFLKRSGPCYAANSEKVQKKQKRAILSRCYDSKGSQDNFR